MKTTLLVKRIDIWLQLLAFFLPLAGNIVYPNCFFLAYLTVGGVQLLSCIANRLLLQRHFRASSRIGYEITLLLIIVLGAAAYFFDDSGGNKTGVFLMFLLVAGIVLGIWYFIITTLEAEGIKKAIALAVRNAIDNAKGPLL